RVLACARTARRRVALGLRFPREGAAAIRAVRGRIVRRHSFVVLAGAAAAAPRPTSPRIMKILFVMRHSGYVRNFESTVRMLCERGHTVDLAFQIAGTHWLLDPSDMTTQLADSYPRFSRSTIPVRDDRWGYAARELRLGLDYLRYLRPAYRNAPKLRARAEREVPAYLLEKT